MKKCNCFCHIDGRKCSIPGGCCVLAETPRLIPSNTAEKTIKAKITFSGEEVPLIITD